MKRVYFLILCLFATTPAWSADTDTPAATPVAAPLPVAAPIKIGTVDLSTLDTTNADVMAAAKVLLEKAAKEQGVVLICDPAALLFIAPTLQKVDLSAAIKALVATNPRRAATAPEPVTKEKEAAATALKELRKMASVVKAGVNHQSYSERLADLKASVDEALLGLPDGNAKDKIKAALDSYQDAGQWWNDSFTMKYVSILLKYETDLITKYDIKITPSTDKFAEIYGSAIEKQLYVSEPLSTIWNAAERNIKEAEVLTK